MTFLLVEMVESSPWMNHLDFQRQSSFVFSSYQRLENDILEYFEYVPLREKNLSLTSVRLADFLLRMPPILTKAFKIMTFGFITQNMFDTHLGFIPDKIKQEEILKLINDLHEKKKLNEDYLNHYYQFHNNKIVAPYIWRGKLISEREVKLKEIISRIEYDEIIKPFNSKNWHSWIDCRNEIEHRERTEADLEKVLQGLACIYMILERVSSGTPEYLKSNLFDFTR